MKKITYLLGAGASADCIPVVSYNSLDLIQNVTNVPPKKSTKLNYSK